MVDCVSWHSQTVPRSSFVVGEAQKELRLAFYFGGEGERDSCRNASGGLPSLKRDLFPAEEALGGRRSCFGQPFWRACDTSPLREPEVAWQAS